MENAAKRQMLQGLLDNIDAELFRQDLEKQALDAEIASVTDENTVNSLQQQEAANAEYVQRLRARQEKFTTLLADIPEE